MKSRKFLILLPVLLAASSCTLDPKAQAQRYLDNGNKFFDKGKFKEASIMYRRALQKDMRFGEAYYRLGLTDLKLAAYGDAAQKLRRAVELQPQNADAATKLADLFLLASTQEKQHPEQLLKEVEDLSDHLLQQDPKSFDGHRLKGELAMLHRDPATAVTEFAQANAVNPLQSNLVVGYFQALVANKQYPEGEKLARDLIAKDKSFAPVYDLLYLHYVRQNNLDQAEQILKLKSANNPQRANYLVQLAGFYLQLRRTADLDAVMARLNSDKEFPEGHLLAGDFYFFRAHDFEHARQQYEAGVKAFPKDKIVYQKRLVELDASDNKGQQANELLAQILKEDPKDSDAIAMRAALMLTTGNRDQVNLAVNDLQGLVTKMPQNHLIRFNLARALMAKNDIEGARLQLEESIKLRPDFVVARELLGRVYLATGEFAKALKTSDEILLLDRNSLQAHLMRSNALMGIGEKDKARDELDYITKAFPQNPDAHYQAGYLAYQEKNYKKAEQIFNDMYKANPRDTRGMIGITETMAAEGHLNEAIKMWETAQQKEPERRDLKIYLANMYVRVQRYDDALQIYNNLIQKEPKSADLLYRMAETQRRKGDNNAAIEVFQRCSQASPTDTQCLIELGLLMDGTGKRDQAKPIYEQILKIQPDQPVALNNLAFIKAEEGNDLDAALTMATAARRKSPNSPEIADTLGWIYIKRNQSEEAIRVFQDLVQKNPNVYSFHYHYGMALLQKGDKVSGKRELELAMKDKPSKEDATKIEELLKGIRI